MSNDEKKLASFESILALRDRVPVEEYEMPGNAGTTYIHGFTGFEKGQWQKECKNKDGSVNPELVEPLMFQMCVRNEEGKKLYGYADVPKLKMLPASILGSVTDICMRLSGMGNDADEAILKNLVTEDPTDNTDDS